MRGVGLTMCCDNINIELNNIKKSDIHVGLFIFIETQSQSEADLFHK